MFRKKKGLQAQVTVLGDDAPNPATSAYDELLGGARDEGPTPEQMETMTAEQLQRVIEGSAQAGKESTARALKIATEAREIGANTAETMQQQTAQLERMTDELEVVHDHLDKTERTIDKMTKPKLVRMFNFGKSKGKGLDKQKASRKEQEEREELRAKGLDSIDVREIKNKDNANAMTMQELQREQLLNDVSASTDSNDNQLDDQPLPGTVKDRRRIFGRKKSDNDKTAVTTREIKEDYSGYSDTVATVLRQQDDDLDKIGDVVADMKNMALAMNNELEYQNEVIDEVKAFSEETSRRTKANERKIQRFK